MGAPPLLEKAGSGTGTGTGTGTGAMGIVERPSNSRGGGADLSGMGFDHERLDVYQRALDFMVHAESILRRLPRGRRHLTDQLSRAATSIVLNIAEGAGKSSAADKRRYYTIARGSATESAAILDVCLRLNLIDSSTCREGKQLLERIVAMLIKLAIVFES